MLGSPLHTWDRLFIWLALGFLVYFAYGQHHAATMRAQRPSAGVAAAD